MRIRSPTEPAPERKEKQNSEIHRTEKGAAALLPDRGANSPLSGPMKGSVLEHLFRAADGFPEPVFAADAVEPLPSGTRGHAPDHHAAVHIEQFVGINRFPASARKFDQALALYEPDPAEERAPSDLDQGALRDRAPFPEELERLFEALPFLRYRFRRPDPAERAGESGPDTAW